MPEPSAASGSVLLTAGAAAKLLGVNERTVRRAIKSGRLDATKRGGRFSVNLQAAREALAPTRRQEQEFVSLRMIVSALDPLDMPTRARVLTYINDRYTPDWARSA